MICAYAYVYTVKYTYNVNNILNEMSRTCDQPPCSVSLVAERITALSPFLLCVQSLPNQKLGILELRCTSTIM